MLLDVASAIISYYLLIRWHVRLGTVPRSSLILYVVLVPVIMMIWGVLSLIVRRDKPLRYGGLWSEYLDTLFLNFLGGLVLFALMAATHHNPSRLALGLFPVFSLVLTTVVRLGVRRSVAGLRRRGYDTHQVLVIGPAIRAVPYAEGLLQRPESGLRPVGVLLPPEVAWEVAPDRDRELVGMLAGRRLGLSVAEVRARAAWGTDAAISAVPILGDYQRLREVFTSHVIDQVVIVAPLGEPRLEELAVAAETEGKAVHLVLDDFGARVFRKSTLAGSNIVPLTPEPDPLSLHLKRWMDIAAAAICLLVSSPVLGLIALAVKVDSPGGPILFQQQRVGLHGRTFVCYKFRSMVPEAERLRDELLHRNEMNGPVFKIRDDPRVTRVGRILRKFSLDELPQFWNVLVGEMSLVGPRPPLPEEVKRYPEAAYRRRLSVRPGLTCLWQVSGRNSVDFEQWMHLDLQYVDQWSLGLDFKILLRTIPTLLFGTGM